VSFDLNQAHPDRRDPPPAGGEPPRPPAPRDVAATVTDRLTEWIRWVGSGRILGAAAVVLAVGAGGWWLLRTPPPPTEAGLPYAATSTAPGPTSDSVVTATTQVAAALIVHVAGAVARPGVYELPGGSRVLAAVDAAGGALPRADPSALNLAAPLVDGERIYVPRLGEHVAMAAPTAPSGSESSPPGPVDVNRASVEQLDELPGIGPTTASAIVDHREQHGPFATVDDLEAVRGIGPAKLDAIRELVTV
jgi:competence protein ComEA